MSFYKKIITVTNEIDKDGNLVMAETRDVKNYLLGIRVGQYRFDRRSSKYTGEPIIEPATPLGFSSKKIE